jgi:hypothetical protein
LYTLGFKEQSQLETNIELLGIEELKWVLEYLYTDQLDLLSPEMAISVLIACCQYDGLERLKRKCEMYLQPSVMELDNTCTIFKVADLYNNSFLRGISLYYITAHLADVMKTEGWEELSKEQKEQILDKATEWKLM